MKVTAYRGNTVVFLLLYIIIMMHRRVDLVSRQDINRWVIYLIMKKGNN